MLLFADSAQVVAEVLIITIIMITAFSPPPSSSSTSSSSLICPSPPLLVPQVIAALCGDVEALNEALGRRRRDGSPVVNVNGIHQNLQCGALHAASEFGQVGVVIMMMMMMMMIMTTTTTTTTTIETDTVINL
jgi:hypothetical protein